MRFVNTKRFSPVIHEGDLPWENDLFHHRSADIPTTKVEYLKFLDVNNIMIDEDWWDIQHDRCLNGYSVPNAIEPGGDAIVDEVDAFWNHSLTDDRYLPQFDYTIPPNSCYLPQYTLLIKNREVHLTNRHYFYLNFWKIYRLDQKKKIKDSLPPKFTDLDFLFARRMEMMFEQELDDSEAKARQKGFSEKGGGMVLGWNYHFVRASVSIVAGGVSDDAGHTMENFTKGADDLRNTQFYKERSKGQEDFFRSKHFLSEVRALSFKDNAQALSRFTPYMVIYEEIGKFKKGLILEAKQFVDASLIAEGVKTGYAIYIGTGGDMEDGAADLENIHYNPSNYGCLSYRNKWDVDNNEVLFTGHFTPSWMFRIIDEDGNSLKEKSIADVLEDRAKLKPQDKFTHTTQHALFASDAFLIASGGFFGPSVAQWCNERRAYLKTHKEAQVVERGILEWNDRKDKRKGAYFVPDPNGWLLVAEHPVLDSFGVPFRNLYRTSTDSYDQDEAYSSSSKGSCWVKKGFLSAESSSNKYVAGFLERPELSVGGREVFYEYTALLTAYYGGQNLIEHSNLLIFEWYEKNGCSWMLKLKPEFVTAKMVMNSKTSNMYGIDPSTKPYWLKMHADWLKTKENIDNCDFEVLLEAWAKFKYRPGVIRYNCDVTIATSLCTVYEEDEKEMMVYGNVDAVSKRSTPRYKTINGVMQLVFE
jgi:hypothetical protein